MLYSEPMSLADWFGTSTGKKSVRNIERQLTRIADALERLSPPVTPPENVTVEDVDTTLQQKLEVVEQTLWKRLGRAPSADETLAEYEQMKHLL